MIKIGSLGEGFFANMEASPSALRSVFIQLLDWQKLGVHLKTVMLRILHRTAKGMLIRKFSQCVASEYYTANLVLSHSSPQHPLISDSNRRAGP